jgi:hypothetical protein
VAIRLGSFIAWNVAVSSSSRAWSAEVCRVGRTSRRVALPPPEVRTMVRNDVFSSLSSCAFWASPELPVNCGSLTLSKVSLFEWFRKAAASWVHVAL